MYDTHFMHLYYIWSIIMIMIGEKDGIKRIPGNVLIKRRYNYSQSDQQGTLPLPWSRHQLMVPKYG